MEIPHEDQSSHYDHENDKFAYLSMRDRIELGKRKVQQSQWGSKYALNEDMSMKAKLASMAKRIEEFELRNVHTEAQPQAMPTSFEYINHPTLQANLNIKPKDKFAYLSMRDRIELGKRKVQQSQWGSKYPLNGDDSYEHTVGECPTIPTVRDMYGYQSSYTSSWNNHPNLTTQPQPQPSMSTSSLEQAILKISKVMEDFVGERKLPPQPHHNLQGTNAKRSRKVLKIDTLVGIAMTTLWTNLPLKIIRFKMIKGYLNPLKHPLLQGREEKRIPLDQMGRMPILFRIQGEFSMKWYDAGKIEMEVKQRKQGSQNA
ncbi:hypothetical protein CK203_063622 [Vitis vinifera]|uniref:Uncharacterized protein n=1 Tax=Vitis vinifera TaxID=29760 RepID=A0A438G4V5_VITVI|nr:hypothetical protein CK203_063622 [Vitis vinifera]